MDTKRMYSKRALVILWTPQGEDGLSHKPKRRLQILHRDGTHLMPSFTTTETLEALQMKFPKSIFLEEDDNLPIQNLEVCTLCSKTVNWDQWDPETGVCLECLDRGEDII